MEKDKFSCTFKFVVESKEIQVPNAIQDLENDLLKHWHKKILNKEYHSLREIVADFPKADAIGNNRIVLNIKGNDYRLISKV